MFMSDINRQFVFIVLYVTDFGIWLRLVHCMSWEILIMSCGRDILKAQAGLMNTWVGRGICGINTQLGTGRCSIVKYGNRRVTVSLHR